MKVLVDTCVWSQVLRHKNPDPLLGRQLQDLIQDGRVALIGPIRQELLSGISDEAQFKKLKERLAAFSDVPLTTEAFVRAAEFSNTCRKNGIQGSTTDFVICAVACLERLAVFTTDADFTNYRRHLPLVLFEG
jgi:predicted nucleic acid-binding protein